MIHGIYVRNKPHFRWRLINVVVSSELAIKDRDDALIKAKKEGFEEAEAAVKTFESSFFIPQTLLEIKEDNKILFN